MISDQGDKQTPPPLPLHFHTECAARAIVITRVPGGWGRRRFLGCCTPLARIVPVVITSTDTEGDADHIAWGAPPAQPSTHCSIPPQTHLFILRLLRRVHPALLRFYLRVCIRIENPRMQHLPAAQRVCVPAGPGNTLAKGRQWPCVRLCACALVCVLWVGLGWVPHSRSSQQPHPDRGVNH